MRKPTPRLKRHEILDWAMYLHGYTIPEVAEALNVNERTMRAALISAGQLSDDKMREAARYIGILPERLMAEPKRKDR
jgi:hypothetical protein